MNRTNSSFLALFISFLFSFPLAGEEIDLLTDGRTAYQLVLPDQSPTREIDDALVQTARLIQTAFLANGASIPVVRESERKNAENPAIYLGNTKFAQANGIELTTLDGWGYYHRVIEKRHLVLAGRDQPAPAQSDNPRRPSWDRIGTAKAVADFLRQYAGVRFLYPEMSPYRALHRVKDIELLNSPSIEFLKTARIGIPAQLDLQHTPAIRFNTAHPQGGSIYDIANNRFPRVDEIFGGHTWARAVSPEKYRQSNPEYFALVNGKRLLEGHGQYCLSNPEVRELIYRDVARLLDKGYAAADVGQPDGFRACQCQACKDLYGTGDDWGEKIWIFNRNLAERVLKSHPGKKLNMMSYILTAKPPRSFTQFPANTSIMLTGTNETDIDPWRGHKVPGGFTGYLYNWCPNLATRYTPMRTPQFVEEQARRLKRNHIQAFYRDGPGALYGLEGPVYYTMGRMYDDPENLSAAQLVPEFVDAAFAESAWHMMRFYGRLYHTITLYSDHIGTRCDVWTYQPLEGRRRKTIQDPFRMIAFLYPPALLTNLETLLAGAESKARTEKVKARLALVRREFNYIKHFAKVVHLHQAYQIQPDYTSRDRLLNAIDARNKEIATYYNERGRAVPVSDHWSHVTFPPGGHNEAHLRLAYNNYQEPYENTCFNWDTDKIRSAPLPGAKQLPVLLIPNDKTVTRDSSHWDKVPHETISDSSGTTAFQILADTSTLYLKVTGLTESSSEHRIDVFVVPKPGQPNAFQFGTGLDANSKQEAAAGFIREVMDPRFGQYDPDWTGEWNVEIYPLPDKNQTTAFFSIPFSTLEVKPPRAGTFWRSNLALSSKENVSTWATAAGVLRPGDQSGFGEWVFQSEIPDQN